MKEINVDIDTNLINPVYREVLEKDNRIRILFGGSGSGKSRYKAQETIIDVLNGRNYLIVRNTAASIKDSTWNEITKTISDFGLNKLFHINKSERTITCINGYQMKFKGLDDLEKIKSITPPKGALTDIWIEEATEVSQNKFGLLRKRLRGSSDKKKRITLTFNPILKTHWIFKEFFQKHWRDTDKKYESEDLYILHTTYKDNQFLEEDDIKDLEGEKDQYLKDVYTLGKWGIIGNVIYNGCWEVADLSSLIPTFLDKASNGLDFGYVALHPAVFVRVYYNPATEELFIFDEFYGEYLSNDEIAAEINKRIAPGELVVCDSAQPQSIDELRSKFYINAIGAEKGPGSVLFGIKWLRKRKWYVHHDCQNFINELDRYKWKEDKNGNALLVPVKMHDNGSDALRYALEEHMKYKDPLEVKTAASRKTPGITKGYTNINLSFKRGSITKGYC